MTRIKDRAGPPRPRAWRPVARSVVIRTDDSTRYVQVSARAQVGLAIAFVMLAGWGAFASAALMATTLERDGLATRLATIDAGYVGRIAELEGERDALHTHLGGHETRLTALSRELAQQQTRLVGAAEAQRERSIDAQTLRAKLSDAVARRDEAVTDEARMARTLETAQNRLAAADTAESEWSATMGAVSDALVQTAAARDLAATDAGAADAALRDLRANMAEDRARRERMLAQLEDAVQIGLGALSPVFARAGLDVDRLVASVRREYSGEGGPFIPVNAAIDDGASLAPGSEAARVASLMTALERTSLMRIAVKKLPLAAPVRSAYRFTSGFGVRRDPKNGRSRMHNGADFAAGRGTPIHSTGDGVVIYAGWQSGYGRVIKIRHAFGFETVYAHLNKTRVKVGERVAQGDRIADMGSTGRSTGVHLHYEVRVGGKPVNPLKYIEAARNVL